MIKKTTKSCNKSMPKSVSISASFFEHFGSILAPFLIPKWISVSFRNLTCSTFFALGSQTGPQGRPRHQNGTKKRAQGPQKTPTSHPKGRPWGPKRTKREAQAPKRTQKMSQKSSQSSSRHKSHPKGRPRRQNLPTQRHDRRTQTMKHGGGTGVSHWIYIYIYIYFLTPCIEFL